MIASSSFDKTPFDKARGIGATSGVNSRASHALFKLFAYETLERWASVGALIEDVTGASGSSSERLPAMVCEALRERHRRVFGFIASHQSELECAFSAGKLTEGKLVEQANKLPEAVRVLRQSQHALAKIERLLAQTGGLQQRAELGFLMSETRQWEIDQPARNRRAKANRVRSSADKPDPKFWTVYEEIQQIDAADWDHPAWAASVAWPVTPSRLPIRWAQNPVGWLLALRSQITQLSARLLAESAEGHKAMQTLRMRLPSVAQQAYGADVVLAALIGIRCYGPAWYFTRVMEAVNQFDTGFLQILEPLMFHALNFFNFSDKNLVLMHDSVLRGLPLWQQLAEVKPAACARAESGLYAEAAHTGPEADALGGSFALNEALTDALDNVLSWAEDQLPDAHACQLTQGVFTDKHLKRCAPMEDILGDDMLIASHRPYSLAHVNVLLQEKYGDSLDVDASGVPVSGQAMHGLHGAGGFSSVLSSVHSPGSTSGHSGPSGHLMSVYHLIGMLAEEPISCREMITAGWLHKLNRASVMVYDTLLTSAFETDNLCSAQCPLPAAALRFMNHVNSRSRLLLKSMETAQVHQMLMALPTQSSAQWPSKPWYDSEKALAAPSVPAPSESVSANYAIAAAAMASLEI
ncbi:MAG: hypothetical protein VKJ06_04430 [Vampirovibrionales bacterium]|nr:hypothetical protein [Vampirovibrionales bacterium]